MNGADACHQCSFIKGCAAGKNHNKKGIREVNSNQEKSPKAEVNPRLEVEEVQSQYISRVVSPKSGSG